jgi:HD-GYP domain-containing protein (c-di-GMP phosphodiesterase class II)
MSYGEALTIMRDGRGTHFDPEILDAFLSFAESYQNADA